MIGIAASARKRIVPRHAAVPAEHHVTGDRSEREGFPTTAENHVESGRVFRLIDVEDPAALPEVTMPWTDIGNLDVYPVMEVETI